MTFYIQGTPDTILGAIRELHPEIDLILERARTTVQNNLKIKREIYPYQAACLYHLVKDYDKPGAQILEIGTALGFSACIMTQAAPEAQVITLNPKEAEVPIAVKNLRRWPKVQVIQQFSMDYLVGAPLFDVIFIDGDHKRIELDFGFFNHLKPGGMMVFHDYSPEHAASRPCPPVYNALNHWASNVLCRPLDIVIVDDSLVGMAGFYFNSQTLPQFNYM